MRRQKRGASGCVGGAAAVWPITGVSGAGCVGGGGRYDEVERWLDREGKR